MPRCLPRCAPPPARACGCRSPSRPIGCWAGSTWTPRCGPGGARIARAYWQARTGRPLVPDPDLLQPAIAGPLAAALRRGTVILERDGLSRRYPARALLVTVTSSHAPRYPALLDLAGLRLPAGAGDALPEAHTLGAAVQAARATLPQVMIADDQVAALAALALRLGAPGLRSEYLAARAARAIAALAGHDPWGPQTWNWRRRSSCCRAPRRPRPLPRRRPPGSARTPRRGVHGGEDEASGGEDRARAAAERLIAAQAALLPPGPSRPCHAARGAGGGWRGAHDGRATAHDPARPARPGARRHAAAPGRRALT